jgi:putative flippase GtrA
MTPGDAPREPAPPRTREPGFGDVHVRRAWVERSADRLIPRRFQRYREVILYLAVGGWNTLFGYLNFVALYYFLEARLPVAVILVMSYALSIANAYICYRYVVFRSRGSVLREMPRFTSVYLVALAANLVILPLALRWLPLSAYAVQALFTIAVVVLSYFGHKYFSFGGGSRGRQGQGNDDERQSRPQSPAPGGE